MRIAANLSVKDEVELIEQTIHHLRAIGVDLIIACDMHSTDGTYEILEKNRSDRDFWVFRLSDQDSDDFQSWGRANVALAKSARVDWVLFLDADEYWIPASGSLKDCYGLEEADLLLVDRFNISLGPGGPTMPDKLIPEHYEDLLLLVEPIRDPRTHLEQNSDAPWIRGEVQAKLMVRPERIGSLELGGHNIIAGDLAPLRRRRPDDLIIAHLPFTTRSRFARKVDNIRRVFRAPDRFVGTLTAWHWRRWLALADQGRLDDEFDRTVFDARTIADCRAQGLIRSAGEVFRDRLASPAHLVHRS